MIQVALWSLFALQAALAQTFQVQPDPVLVPVPGSFYENGLGSPAVVWDPDQERYLMLFETRLTDPTPNCPVGEWAIGVAWSVDGQSWTIWDTPVITPEAGYRSCVVAHPTALYEDGEIHVWFKAHDAAGPSGVGYAHGNVYVLTYEERIAQLMQRSDAILDQQAADLQALEELLESYEDWLDRVEDALEDLLGEDAEEAQEELEHAIHEALEAIERQQVPDLQTVVDRANDLLGWVVGQTDPQLVDIAEATQVLIDELIAAMDAQAALDQALANNTAALDEVILTGWTQEAHFVGTDQPVISITKFGYPTVAKVNGVYTMLLAKVPNIYEATSTDRLTWEVNWTPVMTPGVSWWAPDELYNPALVCDEASNYPYITYFGGRDMFRWWVQSGGWSDAVSSSGLDWLINTDPYFQFDGSDAWRHWDVMRVGAETVVWFSEKDADGRNQIKLAYTSPTWDPAQISSRICN